MQVGLESPLSNTSHDTVASEGLMKDALNVNPSHPAGSPRHQDVECRVSQGNAKSPQPTHREEIEIGNVKDQLRRMEAKIGHLVKTVRTLSAEKTAGKTNSEQAR